MEKIDIEALNQELPEDFEAIRDGTVNIYGHEFYFGELVGGHRNLESFFSLRGSKTILLADDVPEFIEALKVIQRFMKEANE